MYTERQFLKHYVSLCTQTYLHARVPHNSYTPFGGNARGQQSHTDNEKFI